MTDVFGFHEGDSPLLISVPHAGTRVPGNLRGRMTAEGAAIPDTDWHVARLYSFAHELGAGLLVANYSRYVVDLNRPSTDEALYEGQVATGLCPGRTFAGDPIYRDAGGVEADARVQRYWRPYHAKLRTQLDALREAFGYALLWDAHSIASVVPRLFDGELPALNVGTDDGRSCAAAIGEAVAEAAAGSGYGHVVNGRFRGGFITRHYGDPAGGVHAVQLEIAQRVYMDEASGVYDVHQAERLRATLRRMLEALLITAEEKLKV
ncbi:MAG: N-formylglutamate deformylase [Proteobacteria bacterium]|nr:N-formylglutamate deformylase [Pseudomonadota bacterium]